MARLAGPQQGAMGAFRAGLERWENRGVPAPYGTWRGLAWSVFIALAFLELTHPSKLVRNFPAAMVVLAVVTAAVLVVERRNVRFPRVPWPAMAFLGLAAISVLWSIDRSDTVQMTGLYAWLALFAAICVAQTDAQTLLRGVAWGGVALVCLTLGSVVVDPAKFGGGLIFPGTGPGVHGTRGIVAYSLGFALCAALARRSTRRREQVEIGITIALNLTMVVIAPAATGRVAVIALLAAVAAIEVLRRFQGRALARAKAIMLGLVGLVVVIVVLGFRQVVAILGRSPDLNGRVQLWIAIVPTWLQAPIGGYGFGAVWRYGWLPFKRSKVRTQINQASGFDIYHGHNIVMDMLPQLGALGAVVVLIFLVVLGLRGVRAFTERPQPATWALLTLVALVAMGMTEPVLITPVGWFCVLAATAACHRRARVGVG